MSKPAGSIVIDATIAEHHPELPNPVVLEDEQFVTCPNEDPAKLICIDYPNAQKIARNKAKLLSWMKDSRSLIDYYQSPSP